MLAPSTIEDAFYCALKAFDLADKYQIPVIILSDQLLADSFSTVEAFDLDSLKIQRHILVDEELKKVKDYKRYQITESGVSPRPCREIPYGLVVVDSDEHDESGHITEDLDFIRPEMVKRETARMKTC